MIVASSPSMSPTPRSIFPSPIVIQYCVVPSVPVMTCWIVAFVPGGSLPEVLALIELRLQRLGPFV